MLRKLPAVFAEVCYSSGFCPAAGLQSGDEQGAAPGSQSCTHVERGPQQRGGVGGSCRGVAVPQRSGVCRGCCSAGWRRWPGTGRCRGGSVAVSRVPVSSMHAHTLRRRGRSGRRQRRAAGGAGRQAGCGALLRPEAVIVLWGKAQRGNRGALTHTEHWPRLRWDSGRSRTRREKPGLTTAGPGRAMPGEPAGITRPHIGDLPT